MSATMSDEQRKAEKAEKERERRARKKAEKAAAAEASSQFRANGTPAEIVAVLTEAGGPLPVKEITDRILARGNASLKGKTPQATVAALLSVQVRKDGSPFVKVDRGVFGLKA